MNITFLIIIFLLVVVIYLLKNVLKIPIKGLKKYFWLLLCITLLMLSESVIGLTGWITSLPHSYLITFPLHFLIVPILLLIFHKITNNRKVPILLKKYGTIPFWIAFFSLLWVYGKDTADKSEFLTDPPVMLRILLIALLVSNTFFIVQSFKAVYKRGQKRVLLLFQIFPILYTILQATIIFNLEMFYTMDFISNALLLLLASSLMISTVLFSEKRSDNELLLLMDEAVISQKMYLEPGLTLKTLSAHLGRTPNDVSKVINSQLSMGFNDYINKCRVHEAIALIKNPKNKKYTLETLSKMAGFNSSTTFNTAFKKFTGKTPKAYRKLTES